MSKITTINELLAEFQNLVEIMRVRRTCKMFRSDFSKRYNSLLEELPWRISVEYLIFSGKLIIHSSWTKIGYFNNSDENIEVCDVCSGENTYGYDNFLPNKITTTVWSGRGSHVLKTLIRDYPTINLNLKEIRFNDSEKKIVPFSISDNNLNNSFKTSSDIQVGSLMPLLKEGKINSFDKDKGVIVKMRKKYSNFQEHNGTFFQVLNDISGVKTEIRDYIAYIKKSPREETRCRDEFEDYPNINNKRQRNSYINAL